MKQLLSMTQLKVSLATMHPDYEFNLNGNGTGREIRYFLFSVDAFAAAAAAEVPRMISVPVIVFDLTTMNYVTFNQEYIPVHKHWRLNERSYGDLVGLNKKEVVKKFGKDQVKRWRRSYDEPPPPMNDDHEHHPKRDPRYRLVGT